MNDTVPVAAEPETATAQWIKMYTQIQECLIKIVVLFVSFLPGQSSVLLYYACAACAAVLGVGVGFANGFAPPGAPSRMFVTS